MGEQIVVGGLYSQCTPPFFRGVLPGISRSLKASIFDACVLLLVKEEADEDEET